MRTFPCRLLLALLFICAPVAARADESGSSGYTGPGDIPLPNLAEGAEINQIRVSLREGGGNPARDQTLVARLKERLADLQGETFNRMIVEARLAKARERAGVAIDYRLESEPSARGVILIVEIDTRAKGEVASAVGIALGQTGAFPILYRSARALFTTILAGGLGAYSEVSRGSASRACSTRKARSPAACRDRAPHGPKGLWSRASASRCNSATRPFMPSAL